MEPYSFQNFHINSFWNKFGLVFNEIKGNANVPLLRETKQDHTFPKDLLFKVPGFPFPYGRGWNQLI